MKFLSKPDIHFQPHNPTQPVQDAIPKAIISPPKHAELNVSVALNPTDWKHIDYLAPPGVLVGCDYAGIVEDVGKGVKKPFKKGETLSNSQTCAACLPNFNLFHERVSILIYGGSTATGTLAVQFAQLSGYEVLTTYSPRNLKQVKEFGADILFEYNDPNTADAIRERMKDGITLAFDTISLESTRERQDRATMAYTAFGESFKFGPNEIPARQDDRTFSGRFCGIFEDLLAAGKIMVHPPRVGGGGDLKDVLEGLDLLREGKISGEKLVYNIADTL
ncbi:zinc-binding oxidoreductase [Penicillium canescens]|nr:zinc-binding oxidoreductase [Penicillium canescens]